MLLRFNMKKFSDDTTVHGLKELYYNKKIVWRGIWLIVMTTATGMTAYQVGKSVQQYVDQPTITTILPLESGKFKYPPLRICYLHWSSWVDWNKVIELNISKPILYFGLSYLDKVFSQDAFDLNASKEDFDDLMIQNGWTYLSEFYMAISEDYPKYLAPDDDEIKMAFNRRGFYDVLAERPFCYTIKEKTLDYMIKAMSLSLRNSMSRNFEFRVEKLPQVSFNSYFTEPEYATYIKYVLQDTYTFTESVEDQGMFTMFNPQILLPNSNSDAIKLNSDVEKYSIKIKGSVHKRESKNGAKCIEGQATNSADYSCEVVCYSQFISKWCRIVPFQAAFSVHADEPMITCRREILFMDTNKSIKSFSTVLDECQCHLNMSEDDANEVIDCLTACKDGCEKWDFEASVTYTLDQSFNKDFADRTYTSIRIEYPSEESVLVISEIESQSWESFIANVGGLLGIWLGASIVSFVQTIYLCCFSEEHESNTINIFKNVLVKDKQSQSSL